jgi:hypothetical protein
MKLGRILYAIPQHDAILRKGFNSNNIPSISSLEKTTVLLMNNQHCHISAQHFEINKKWLLLSQKDKVGKNLLSSVIGRQADIIHAVIV